MFAWLRQIEASALSRWLSESEAIYAFPGILVVHTVGMALAAGSVATIALRLLGVARQIPISRLRELLRVAWIGLLLNILSGVLLVLAYPTKALTNPVFYLKLLAIGATVVLARYLDRHVLVADEQGPTQASKWASATLLALTVLVILTGRLLPYTYIHLFAPPG